VFTDRKAATAGARIGDAVVATEDRSVLLDVNHRLDEASLTARLSGTPVDKQRLAAREIASVDANAGGIRTHAKHAHRAKTGPALHVQPSGRAAGADADKAGGRNGEPIRRRRSAPGGPIQQLQRAVESQIGSTAPA